MKRFLAAKVCMIRAQGDVDLCQITLFIHTVWDSAKVTLGFRVRVNIRLSVAV